MTMFRVGDHVAWTSQAAGIARTKVGTVVEVVPAGRDPRSPGDFGAPREHVSYVIRAEALGRATRSWKLYWPRVSALRPAAGPGVSPLV